MRVAVTFILFVSMAMAFKLQMEEHADGQPGPTAILQEDPNWLDEQQVNGAILEDRQEDPTENLQEDPNQSLQEDPTIIPQEDPTRLEEQQDNGALLEDLEEGEEAHGHEGGDTEDNPAFFYRCAG